MINHLIPSTDGSRSVFEQQVWVRRDDGGILSSGFVVGDSPNDLCLVVDGTAVGQGSLGFRATQESGRQMTTAFVKVLGYEDIVLWQVPLPERRLAGAERRG
ncbi:MAG: hypothetical protein WCV93_01655 [Candidatus Shapirobacteria bacterium]|jgi:hypothetical protein